MPRRAVVAPRNRGIREPASQLSGGLDGLCHQILPARVRCLLRERMADDACCWLCCPVQQDEGKLSRNAVLCPGP